MLIPSPVRNDGRGPRNQQVLSLALDCRDAQPGVTSHWEASTNKVILFLVLKRQNPNARDPRDSSWGDQDVRALRIQLWVCSLKSLWDGNQVSHAAVRGSVWGCWLQLPVPAEFLELCCW